jgi:hypothetical protein
MGIVISLHNISNHTMRRIEDELHATPNGGDPVKLAEMAKESISYQIPQHIGAVLGKE